MTTQPVEIACTLDADQLPGRAGAWRDLLSRVTDREPIAGGVRLVLSRSPEVAADAAALATMEVGCCAFFTFRLTIDDNALLFDVTAPPDGQAVLELLLSGETVSDAVRDAPVTFVTRR